MTYLADAAAMLSKQVELFAIQLGNGRPRCRLNFSINLCGGAGSTAEPAEIRAHLTII